MKKNYRFQKAAMFRISTEEMYYFIMELFLFYGKYLFLGQCEKQLASSNIRNSELKGIYLNEVYTREKKEKKKAGSIKIILNGTGL